MSGLKAKAILKTLRWYHLGFCFLWVITFAALVFPEGTDAATRNAYDGVFQACLIVGILIMVVVARTKGVDWLTPSMILVPGVTLVLGVAVFYIGFYYANFNPLPVFVAAVLIGVSEGIFFVLWQYFFTSEGVMRTALYIPLSAFVSGILSFVVIALPFWMTIACGVVVLPILSVWSLGSAIAEVQINEAVKYRDTKVIRRVLRDLWRPIVCVCVLGFIWEMASEIVATTGPVIFMALLGFSIASCIIAVISLFSERGVEVMRTFQVLFPVVTALMIALVIFGQTMEPVLVGFLMFGFEILNLLLIITCAVYAHERELPAVYVYAIGLIPVYGIMLVGQFLGGTLNEVFAHDLAELIGILFVGVYLLSFVMFLISWRRKLTAEGERASNIVFGVDLRIPEENVADSMRRNVDKAPTENDVTNETKATNRSKKRKPAPSTTIEALTDALFEPSDLVGTAAEDEMQDGHAITSSDNAAFDSSRALTTSPSDNGTTSSAGFAGGVSTSTPHDLEQALLASLNAQLEAMNLPEPLSQREREVAALLMRGLSVSAVSQRLFISDNTVRGHAKSIYRKLGVHSRQQLMEVLNQ